MSESIRQNNLFAAEDWKVVYNAFRNVSLQAYDYESIYNALLEYLRNNNPDEFNDYVQHSEMMAHINMLAYLGQAYAFRIDLNARENFFDTAERRESVIKLARHLTYKPKRNRAAHGLCKLVSVSTSEPILDNNGNNLAGREINWDQINNSSWYENFIKILNHAFISVNRFGEPIKRETIDGIRTELYAINNTADTNVVYDFSSSVNGKSYNFEITSSYITEDTIEEDVPDPYGTFNLIYRNDERGNSSENTGFFLFFKQGALQYTDYQYDVPQPDREELIEVDNINETDVWLQEIDGDGRIEKNWVQIPNLVGQNVIYNNVYLNERDIFSVNTEENNHILIRYSDGNFGNVPLGYFRVWYRTSVNESFIIRPNDITNQTINISYIGNDNQRYNLTLKFSLVQTIDNAEPEESIEDIKRNAPLVHYTQDRMINGEDYNIFPLTQSNLVRKIKAVNRTHAGHSRYIDITDPTGSHSNITVVGDDAYMFKDYKVSNEFEIIENNTNFRTLVSSKVEYLMNTQSFKNFFYHDYRQTILSEELENLGGYGSDYLTYQRGKYVWKSLPRNEYNSTGYIVDTQSGSTPIEIGSSSNLDETKLLRENSKVLFGDDLGNEKWVTITNLEEGGVINTTYATVGNIELSSKIKENWYIKEVIPGLRRSLTSEERILVETEMLNNRSFGIRYDFINDSWIIIPQDNIINTDLETFTLEGPELPNDPDNRWLIKAIFVNENNNKVYNFYSRGLQYIFGSDKQVRFFFKNTSSVIDAETGRSVRDYIKILETNSDRTDIEDQHRYARAIIGHLYTSVTHSPSEEYDVTNIIKKDGTGSFDYGDVKLYTVDKKEITDWTITIDNGKALLTINSPLLPDNTVTPFKISDVIEVFDLEGTKDTLPMSYNFSLTSSYIREDGVVDYSKILIEPQDSDEDGVPDYPLAFEDIVNLDEYVFFKTYTDFDNITYDRVENSVKILNDHTTTIEEGVIYYCTSDIDIYDIDGNLVSYEAGKFYKGVDDTNGLRQNKATELVDNQDSNGDEYSVKTGRVYTADDPFFFQWKHYAGNSERIDPSISNVIDTYVLTRSYDSSVRSWLKNRGTVDNFPAVPSSNTIKTNLRFIEKNKSTSDQIIYIPAEYKLLFGRTALPQYRAKFKVIKIPGSLLTDNEIKSSVVSAINDFFDIDNWDFGEGFYYTELSAYIHKQLVGNIGSVVIVPEYENSSFGELFEIKAEPNELFLSTATVENVEIVKTYTDSNLRKR